MDAQVDVALVERKEKKGQKKGQIAYCWNYVSIVQENDITSVLKDRLGGQLGQG